MPLRKKSQIKAGVMGGSFNPLHRGHVNSLLTIKKDFKLDVVLVIPAFQPPLAGPLTGASASHRLKMLRLAFEPYPFVEVDERELNRKGISYSWITLESLSREKRFKELFFILGLDQFRDFDRWRDVPKILQPANLIVTSRPRAEFPKSPKELPTALRSIVKAWTPERITLKAPGKSVYFYSLKDRDISSSLIRKRLKNRQSIARLVPSAIDSYIKAHGLYGVPHSSRAPAGKSLLEFCKKELENKKAFDVRIFDFKDRTFPFSTGLIASGSNTRHTKALSRHLKKRVRETFDILPLAQEGESEGRWIVLDYTDVVLHIFYDYVRGFYNLEDIWEKRS